jgi:hypothetical protein
MKIRRIFLLVECYQNHDPMRLHFASFSGRFSALVVQYFGHRLSLFIIFIIVGFNIEKQNLGSN